MIVLEELLRVTLLEQDVQAKDVLKLLTAERKTIQVIALHDHQ